MTDTSIRSRRPAATTLALLGAALAVLAAIGAPASHAAAQAGVATQLNPHQGPSIAALNRCIQVYSTTHTSCRDAGNYPSVCATATCPATHTLTGGGGSCAAGDRKIKSLFPRLDRGEFTIACEDQGTAPQAQAICCKF
jgi:hypothetical protein